MRVFVIGERPRTSAGQILDLDIHVVAARVTRGEARVIRCATPADLPGELGRIAAKQRIAQLDFLDHGGEGMQTLGDGLLFASDAAPDSELIGIELARQIEPLLTETAQLRLLGCNTGEGKAGRMLLLKLARALRGHRIVFGTIDRVGEADFDRDGYAEVMERQRLFSSIAALDAEAPGAMRRFENMRAVRSAII